MTDRVPRGRPPTLRAWIATACCLFATLLLASPAVRADAAATPAMSPQPGEDGTLAAAAAVLESDPRAAIILLTPHLEPAPGALTDTRQEALAIAARALEKLDLSLLALLHWQKVLESGQAEYAAEAFHRASRLAARVHNDDSLRLGMATLDPGTLPDPADRSHAFYLKGVQLDAEDRLTDAVAMLAQVPAGEPDYIRARLLMATVLTRMRQRTVAIATLQDLSISAQDRLAADDATSQLVQLTLARSLYGAGQVDEAIDIYQAFPRRSPAWLAVQSELAWAWYRKYAEQDDWTALDNAIGTVHTLVSPFFRDRYLPEPELLGAQLLYHLCRFVDGGRAVSAFLDRYTPVRDGLKAALSGECVEPGATLRVVLGWRAFSRGDGERPETRVPEPILQVERDRPSLAELERHLAHLATEREVLASRFGSGAGVISTRLSVMLDRHEQAIRSAYDRSLRGELQTTLWDLNQLMRQAQLIRLSMTSAEKTLYEAAAAGAVPVEPPSRRRRKARWPIATRQVWPFEGEYWADELGYYQSRAVPLCPD